MANNTTRFKELIRIDKKQKKWIRQNREKNKCKTDAGFLDLIINRYKTNGVK